MQNSEKRQESRRQAVQIGDKLIALILHMSESGVGTQPRNQPTDRDKTLAALAVAVRESLRAFLTAEKFMK